MKQQPKLASVIFGYEATFGKYQKYEEFIERITYEVDEIIEKLEKNPQYQNTKSEDAITNDICMLLTQINIDAVHGESVGGETDLIVKYGNYTWIAEAKWWKSTGNALEAMRQLSTRYSKGGDNDRSGCVLLYNKTAKLKDKIQKLKGKYLNITEFENLRVKECDKSSFAFKTIHKHQSSGLDYTVRHRALNFFHNPQDKSAKNRKNKKP